MTNFLDELKAKVEAADFDLSVEISDHTDWGGWVFLIKDNDRGPSGIGGCQIHFGPRDLDIATGHRIVAGWNLARRLTSEEGVASARDAILAKVPLGYGMTRDEAETYALAALNALLSDSQP